MDNISLRALMEHYLDYITTPGVLLTLFVLVVPLVFSIIVEDILNPKKAPKGVPGCRRLGLINSSNLTEQSKSPTETTPGIAKVKALFTYPLASCRGVELAVSEVLETGLKYDQRFTFAQLVTRPENSSDKHADGVSETGAGRAKEWRAITREDFPRLALLKTELWLPMPKQGRLKGQDAEQKTKQNGSTGKDAQNPVTQRRPRSRTRGPSAAFLGKLEQGSKLDTSNDWAAKGGCLIIRFLYEPDLNLFGMRTDIITLNVPLGSMLQHAESEQDSYEQLNFEGAIVRAIDVTSEVNGDAFTELKHYLGVSRPLALFRIDEQSLSSRGGADKKSESGFRSSLPLSLLNVATVPAMAGVVSTKTAVKGQLDFRCHKANIYVTGLQALAEEDWKSVAVGRRIGRDENGLFETDAEYKVVVAEETKMPTDASKEHARCVEMKPLFARGIIRVGDSVQVLQSGKYDVDEITAQDNARR